MDTRTVTRREYRPRGVCTSSLWRNDGLVVVVTGSRSITYESVVVEALRRSRFPIREIIVGCAGGVDRITRAWCNRVMMPHWVYYAAWDDTTAPGARIGKRDDGTKYNVLAGHWRNEAMVEVGDAVVGVWDGRSTGTRDCLDRAVAHDKPFYVHRHG